MFNKNLKKAITLLFTSMICFNSMLTVHAIEDKIIVEELPSNNEYAAEDNLYLDEEMAKILEEDWEIFDIDRMNYLSNLSIPAETIAQDGVVPLTLHEGVTDQITIAGEENKYSFNISDSTASRCGIQIVVKNVPSNLDLIITISNEKTGYKETINNKGLGEREEYRSGLFNVNGGDYIVTIKDKNGNINLTDKYTIIYTLDYEMALCLVPSKTFSISNNSRFKADKTVQYSAYLADYIAESPIPSDAEVAGIRIPTNVDPGTNTTYEDVTGFLTFKNSGKTYGEFENNTVYWMRKGVHEVVKQNVTIYATIKQISSGGVVIARPKLYFYYRNKRYV